MAGIGHRCRMLAASELATMVVLLQIVLLCYAVLCSYCNSTIREWVSRWIAAGIPGLNDTEKVRLPEKRSLAVIGVS
jgi:hypothetical protein